MKRSSILRVLSVAVPIALVAAIVPATEVGAKGSSPNGIYNSTISPLPGNMPSVGAEAYAFDEFGNQITFSSTSPGRLSTVVVTMSSWGCQSGHWYDNTCSTTPGATFSEPITFNIYKAPTMATYPEPSELIATVTQTFSVPFRPSDNNVKCPPSDGTGRWYDTSSKTCFHGRATNITFDFTSLNVTLPSSVVFGITYNTSHSGYAPFGASTTCYTSSGGCGYDSLNIALSQEPPSVGTDPNPDTIFQNSPEGSEYCDGGLAGTGAFRLDSPSSPCWGGLIPAVQFKHQ